MDKAQNMKTGLINARIILADRVLVIDNMLYKYMNGIFAVQEEGVNIRDLKKYLREQKRELNQNIDLINKAVNEIKKNGEH